MNKRKNALKCRSKKDISNPNTELGHSKTGCQ